MSGHHDPADADRSLSAADEPLTKPTEPPTLLPHHLEMLTTGSGLSASIVAERGYRSVTRDGAIEAGFAPYQARAGLLIPLHNVRGERAGYSLRPDVPRSHRNGKTAKYEQPKGSVPILDVPLRCREMLDDPAIPLDLTEGAKKADSLADRGACAVNLSGVWNWRGTNRKGGKTVLADWDSVALNGRKVQIIFDSDVATKPEVGTALRRLKAVLESRGARVEVVYLPDAESGKKQGVDDFLAAGHSRDELARYASTEVRSTRPAGALPEIYVTGRFLTEIAGDCWKVLADGNFAEYFVFSRERKLVGVRLTGRGEAEFHVWLPDDLRYVMERQANFMRTSETGDVTPGRFPQDVLADMMAAWDKPLPKIRGIVGTPTFTADGRLITTAGYQAETELWYDPIGQPVPAVPLEPTSADIERAKSLLLNEWLGDFPFTDEASRANALAMAVSVVARDFIDGCTPLFAVDAPTPGTGKGLFVETLALIATGTSAAIMTEVRDDDELRKKITSVLRRGRQLNVIDNVKRPLASAHLSALLTARVWDDRLLGSSEMLSLPNRGIWIATGDNIRLDGDVTRRTVWVRMDARLDRPWERDGFRHPDLPAWAAEYRHKLVWALLVLVRNWLRAGRPAWTGKLMGSYEAWGRIVGGVLQSAGIEGFLGNRDEFYRRADDEGDQWRTFVRAWWNEHSENTIKASGLVPLVRDREHLPSLMLGVRAESPDRSLSVKLARELMARRDRSFDGLRIISEGSDRHNGGQLWRLEPAESLTPKKQDSAEIPRHNRSSTDSAAESAESAESLSGACSEGIGNDLPGVEDVGETAADGEGRKKVPQIPQIPQSGSKSAQNAAEPRAEPLHSRREVPRRKIPKCRLCDTAAHGDVIACNGNWFYLDGDGGQHCPQCHPRKDGS